jgi:hypothetical protein
MVILTAWWGLGYSALLISTVMFGWHLLRQDKAVGYAGLILALISTAMLWVGLLTRVIKGNDWPLTSSADLAAGIALILLLLYAIWKLFSPELDSGLTVVSIALVLFAYGLGQRPPQYPQPVPSMGSLLGTLLKVCGGGLLALAAATSIAPLLARRFAPDTRPQNAHHPPTSVERLPPDHVDLQHASELLVRGALLCLAASLAIDTWWLQKVGLGNANDAQQAGIALAWMVYFIALRLRANPRWRGWPWAAILSIGFLCVLPILIDAPWLEMTLTI